MPTGNGPKNKDKHTLQPDVIETTETVDSSGTEADDTSVNQRIFAEDVQMVMAAEGLTFYEAAKRVIEEREELERNNRGFNENIKPKELSGGARPELIKAIEKVTIEDQKRDLILALTPQDQSVEDPLEQVFKLQSFALYRIIKPWLEVSNSQEYREAKSDIDIIMFNLTSILMTVWHKYAKNLRIKELGPGSGDKIRKIVLKILRNIQLGRLDLGTGERIPKKIDVDFVDVNGELMHDTFSPIMDEMLQQLRGIGKRKLGEDHPWKEIVDFIQKHNKKHTNHTGLAGKKVEEAFFAFLFDNLKRHDGEKVESIFKYAIARFFGFKKHEGDLLDELDHKIELPVEMTPFLKTFDSLEGEEVHSTKERPTLITHLGDEICNDFPGKDIKELYAEKLLGEAKPFNKRVHEQNVKNGKDDESNIDATCILFSFQAGSIDYPNATIGEIQKDAEKVLPAYDNPKFNHFVSHLFEKPELATFSDPATGEIFDDHTDCYDIDVNYGEDPDHPGFYGTTHHLVFNKDVNISITIELKDADGNPMGEKTFDFQMIKGQKVFLLPSYKPTAEQMEQLCEENNIKVIDVYYNTSQTNAIFLIRKKTDFEKVWDRKQREQEFIESAPHLYESEEPTVKSTTKRVRDKLGRFTEKKHKHAA